MKERWFIGANQQKFFGSVCMTLKSEDQRFKPPVLTSNFRVAKVKKIYVISGF